MTSKHDRALIERVLAGELDFSKSPELFEDDVFIHAVMRLWHRERSWLSEVSRGGDPRARRHIQEIIDAMDHAGGSGPEPPAEWSRSLTTVCPLGPARPEGRIHSGAVFDVHRIRFDGRALCLKTPALSPGQPRAYSSHAVASGTSIWGGDTGRLKKMTADDRLAERLLLLEAERIRQSAGAWNHDVVALGTWDGVGAHWKSGGAARHPAAWHALSACPHGDLTAENIIVAPDSSRFALIDPGVVVWSAASGQEDLGWMDHTLVMTCTSASYPLLPPTYRPPPELAAAPLEAHQRALSLMFSMRFEGPLLADLTSLPAHEPIWRQALVSQLAEYWDGSRSPEARPLPGDVFALGVLYYAALTGRHPVPHLADDPLWAGRYGENSGEQAKRAADPVRLTDPRDLNAQVSRPEADLAMALLGLRLPSQRELSRMAWAAVAQEKP